MRTTEGTLVGNRLMLAGAILYLLEWVAIIPYAGLVLETQGLSPAEVTEQYVEDADGAAIMAGWFSVVLLGRIAIIAGLRGSLRQSPRQLHLMDFAIGAMVVSVALEIAAFSLGAGAGWLASNDHDPTAVVALDTAGSWLFQLVFGPIAVAVLVSAFAMLRSGLFPTWMCWVGLVAGAVGIGAGVIAGLAYDSDTLASVFDGLSTVTALGFWVWMLATGIFLFRRAGQREDQMLTQ